MKNSGTNPVIYIFEMRSLFEISGYFANTDTAGADITESLKFGSYNPVTIVATA